MGVIQQHIVNMKIYWKHFKMKCRLSWPEEKAAHDAGAKTVKSTASFWASTSEHLTAVSPQIWEELMLYMGLKYQKYMMVSGRNVGMKDKRRRHTCLLSKVVCL